MPTQQRQRPSHPKPFHDLVIPGLQTLFLAHTNDRFVQLIPGCSVVPQPVPCPFPAAGVRGAGDDDAALLGGFLQSPAVETGTETSYRRNTARGFMT